jgi:ABC-2 type transport system ATP-binding protein
MKQLSRGQQQKVAIARSFLTSPNLLLMDEPTTGLDPRSKREVQDVLRGIRRERDVSVLLCTHDLQEAEELADRIAILDQGRVLADDTPDHLTAGGRSLEDVFFELSGQSFADADVDDPEEESA